MILSYLTEKIADGGMKMLKEIPALVMKGWEKAKELLSFWQESKNKPTADRALRFGEEFMKKYKELFADSEKVTEETEKGVDEIIPKEEDAPKAAAQEARNNLRAEAAPKPAKDYKSQPGDSLVKVAKSREGKKPSVESVKEVASMGVATIADLKKSYKRDFPSFQKAFTEMAGKLPDSFGNLFKLGDFDKLEIVGLFGIEMGDNGPFADSSLNMLENTLATLANSNPSGSELLSATKFVGEYFLPNTMRSGNLDEVVKLLRKLLIDSEKLGRKNKIDLMGELCFKIHEDDFPDIITKLGGKLSS